MTTSLAIIPARGGSVGVPHKNLRPIRGTSLVGRAVSAALRAGVTRVAVSTDDDAIATEALASGADVVRRPADIATGTASSESAVLHALNAYSRCDPTLLGDTPLELDSDGSDRTRFTPEVVVFLQATSPFIDPKPIITAVERVGHGEVDVAFAAKESHAFQWREEATGLQPIGHQVGHRPMRQELPPQFQETGAFYIFNRTGFLDAKHRFFGRIAVQEVSAETAIEIDTWQDLQLCEALAPLLDPKVGIVNTLLPDVDALVTDFDGVHTDDRATVDQDGRESVQVNRGDGLGISRLRKSGVPILILSTEENPVVTARARKLQVDVMHGITNKAAAIRDWMQTQNLNPARVAFVGNDINDIPGLNEVGWPIAVADSRPEVRASVRITLTQRGGDGAVREVCDRILAARHQARA